MTILSILFGILVGLLLGLTGGGGAVFAVPLLVYGLGIPPREAVVLSLAVVGSTALVGFVHRCFLGEVGIRTGAIFALAGMLGAPVGVWIAGYLPEPLLLLLFSLLMAIVAIQLWRHADDQQPLLGESTTVVANEGTFQRDSSGHLILTLRSLMGLLLLGLATGVLSGLFGVGGGFVIVPALVLIIHMPIQRAVGTSLMVIALVSLSGVVSHVAVGRGISWIVALPFGLGGIAGLFTGQKIGQKLPGSLLQRGFAIVVLLIAAFILVQNFSASAS